MKRVAATPRRSPLTSGSGAAGSSTSGVAPAGAPGSGGTTPRRGSFGSRLLQGAGSFLSKRVGGGGAQADGSILSQLQVGGQVGMPHATAR